MNNDINIYYFACDIVSLDIDNTSLATSTLTLADFLI